MAPHRWWLYVAFLALLTAKGAGAAVPPAVVGLPGPVTPSGDMTRQRALAARPAWRDFRSGHGDWAALWNEATGTPHRAFGPSIALEGYADDSASVDRAVRQFMTRNSALFGDAPNLETSRTRRIGGVWYLSYRQVVRGVQVLFEDWEFRVGTNGRLMLFGADAHRIPDRATTRPLLTAAAAGVAACDGLPFDPATDQAEVGDLGFLPAATAEMGDPRLVYIVRVRTVGTPGRWIVLVDAANGAILWRHDQVRDGIGGHVSGDVHLGLPTDPTTSRPFEYETVKVGSTTVTADALGDYFAAVTGSKHITSHLEGPYCVVSMPGGGDASFSANAVAPATVNIAWSALDSRDAERDGYYHVNVAHDFIKGIDPGFVGNDFAMPCVVEANGTCNALYDGVGLNFYAAGGGCPSIATIPSIVYHEYGHAINDNAYKQAGAFFGMINAALHEGMADVNASLLADDSVVGRGFYGPGTTLRSVANTVRWPEDRSGDPHNTGLIIAGAFWDLRQSAGLTVARRLAQFARYGKADNSDDGLAMNQYFLETLVADDDDANLANGTPHFAAIDAAFNAHGIGTSYYIGISHTPLPDQTAPGPYQVTATIQYTPNAVHPIGALDPASPTLVYSINGAAWTPRPMFPGPGAGEYTAPIPAVSGAIVRYYLEAADGFGSTRTDPPGAPSFGQHVFVAGAVTAVLTHDMETAPGWTVGDPSDAATTGIWLRAVPVGSTAGGLQVQTAFDHTPDPAQLCWVTGNAAASDPVGTNDVDGGRTTLTTSTFSAEGLGNPAIEYYRWYTNDAGADPGTDLWRTEISNDGGLSWTPVETTNRSDASWRRIVFFVGDYLPPTAGMRMRFIAEDLGLPSVVEAAVDDFRLLSLPATTAVDGRDPDALALTLRLPSPSPFASRVALRYRLAQAGDVSLRIFDIRGRRVRTVEDGRREAGEHAAWWDGQDDEGRPLGNGIYYARLAAGGHERVRSLIRLR